ncbi:MAG TPA: hypothetical protein VKO84_02125 [Gaiellaceae bacterium]|nr:hypothetical protein [Gaiellaceae bacterium]
MSIHTAILVNGILDLGIALAVAATIPILFTFDRTKHEGAIYSFASILPEELAA